MGQSESKETRTSLSAARIQQEFEHLGQLNIAVHVFDQVGSTNDTITQYLSQLDTHAAVIVTADEQIAGRGRLDRSWSSPWAAGIALSIAVPLAAINGSITNVPLRAGLAVHKALASLNVQVKVKWPNDIVTAQGKKLGGLLSLTRDNIIIIGIGLNISLMQDELPTPTATSLALLGHDISREELIALITQNLFSLLPRSDWMSEYISASGTINQSVLLTRINQPQIEGIVVGFGDDGSIHIDSAGDVSSHSVGDIEHLRSV